VKDPKRSIGAVTVVNGTDAVKRRGARLLSRKRLAPLQYPSCVFPANFVSEATSLFLLLLALFVFPIAVYCTIIGMVNRRQRPLMVSGAWDFLGALFAVSGFLLFLGPSLLTGTFRESMNELPFQRGSTSLSTAIAAMWASWWVAWVLYYLLVVGGAAYLVWLRRNTTVIYNIDLRTFETVLARLTDRLGLRASRIGNRLFLGVSDAPVPLTTAADVAQHVTANPAPAADPSSHVSANPMPADGAMDAGAAPRPVRLIAEQLIVDVDAFPMMSNVSLHWRTASPAARANLERELRQALEETPVPENAVSVWLLGIATLLFLLIIMMTSIFVVTALATRR
jgi:hypothetical protein